MMKSIILLSVLALATAVTQNATESNPTAVLGSRTCSLLCHTEVGSTYCRCPQAINLRNATLVCSSLCSMGIPSKRCRCELPSNLCFVYCSLNAEVGIATANCNCQQLLSATEKTPAPPSIKTANKTTPEPAKAKDLCQVLCKANLGANLCDCEHSSSNAIRKEKRRRRAISDTNLRNMADMNYIHHDICHVLCKKGLGFDICDGCTGFKTSTKVPEGMVGALETRDSMCQTLCSHNEGGTLCDCDGHLVRRRRKREAAAFFAFHCALPCKHMSPRDRKRCNCIQEAEVIDPVKHKYKSAKN